MASLSSNDGWDDSWNDASNEPSQPTQQFSRAGNHYSKAGAPAKTKKKSKGSTAMLVFAVILLVAGAVAIGVSAYLFFTSQAEYQVGNEEYASLVEEAVEQDEVSGTPTVDFSSLTSQNSEIVGWVQIPDTVVNYPVVQHSDNDWYLEHTFLGQYNLAGAVFMDYRSSSALNDYVTVIYGHHLKNGAMFARVADYSTQSELDGLRKVYYVTVDGTLHSLEPLCTIVVSGYDTQVLQFDFDSDDSFRSYVESLISRSSAQVSGATSEGVTHLYILSTCSYATDNERTMLVCVERGDTSAQVSQEQTGDTVAQIQSAADEAAGEATDGEA